MPVLDEDIIRFTNEFRLFLSAFDQLIRIIALHILLALYIQWSRHR